jgi:hypothetical protein
MLSLKENNIQACQALHSLGDADRKREWKPTHSSTNRLSRKPPPCATSTATTSYNLPAFPEKKGPKKPTAEPTGTPLHAPSSIRPTLMPAAIALRGSKEDRHVHQYHLLALPTHSLHHVYCYFTHLLVHPNTPSCSRVAAKSPPTALVLASMAPSPLLQHHRPEASTHSRTR